MAASENSSGDEADARQLLFNRADRGMQARRQQEPSLLRQAAPRAAAFAMGVLCVWLALSFEGRAKEAQPQPLASSGAASPERPDGQVQKAETDGLSVLSQQYQEGDGALDGKKRAFITMAYDKPGTSEDYLWGSLALARALQRLSRYPMILMTNATTFPDGTDVKGGFAKLGVKVVPLEKVEIPGTPKWRSTMEADVSERWDVAWWKLQIWKRFTDYEKLVWIDADSMVYRSVDWLFDRDGMWAHADDWSCDGAKPGKICTGVLSVTPSLPDYEGLMKKAEQAVPDLLRGDQELIESYFREIGAPINALGALEAGFGQCLGSAKSPYLNTDRTPVRGAWSTQAFIHKSGGWGYGKYEYGNVCFLPNITRQRFLVGDSRLNICQFHPLGSYWRSLFCEAVKMMDLKDASVLTFCDNDCYFHGGEDGKPCSQPEVSMRGAAANANCSDGTEESEEGTCGGPLNATLSYAAYYSRTKGIPELEELAAAAAGLTTPPPPPPAQAPADGQAQLQA